MEVRMITDAEVERAVDVTVAALGSPGPTRSDWLARRMRHMMATDPEGALVSVEDGRVTGVALAIVRDEVWGLSLLAVDPALHARGTGTALLGAALRTALHARGGIICSSADPKALRLYARAGFDLRPTVGLGGVLRRDAVPGALKSRPSDDLEAAAALGAHVRGAAYGPRDLALLLTRDGARLHMIDGRGFAIHREGSPILVCADSNGIAADLLWRCLADAPPGATISIDLVTAGNDFAVQVGLEAGLAITPEGAVFTRGELGPMVAWLPSGSML